MFLHYSSSFTLLVINGVIIATYVIISLYTFFNDRKKILKSCQDEIARERQEKTFIFQATEIASETESFDEALQRYVNLFCNTFSWPVGHVLKIDKTDPSKLISTKIWFILDRDRMAAFKNISEHCHHHAGMDLTGRVLATGEPEWIEDVVSDDHYQLNKLCHPMPIRCAFAIPVITRAKILAVLEFFSYDTKKPDPAMIKLGRALGRQLGEIHQKRAAIEISTSLEQNEERLNLAIKSSGIGIWDWFVKDDKLIWSDSMYLLFNVSPKNFRHNYSSFEKCLYPLDSEKLKSDMEFAIDHKQRDFHSEFRILVNDGIIKHISSKALLHFDKSGDLIRMTGICQDITDRRQAEQCATQYLNELVSTNQIMQKKNDEILGFYHTVSHELKTPLTSINEFISILLDGLAGEPNEKQKEFLGIAKRNCGQMVLFINDLLDVSKLETGKLVIQQAPCQIKFILEEVIATIKPLADDKNIRLAYHINSQSDFVLCDEKRIMQVIINLLNNSVKFTEPGGQIELTAEDQNEDTLKISVRDTGCGIPSNELGHIFERLYQVSNDNINYNSGLGLGLSICKQIVELHGGEISVTSELNVGSTFSFTLKKSVEKETTPA